MSADPGAIARALAPRRNPPTPVEVVIAKQDADKAKAQAQEVFALASKVVTDAFVEVFELGPEKVGIQEWIRIGEIILSRTLPKVAAKHIEEQNETFDSADMVSLRESVLAKFRERGVLPDEY